MRNALSHALLAAVFAGLSLVAAGCSGGSSDNASSVRIKCIGGQSFCIISCDLGCSQTGCSVTEIAENQRLQFKFSDRVEPSTVSSASISIRTATGVAPDGDFLVVDNEVAFIPRITTVNGVSSFGFLRNETYIITLAGGSSGSQGVRSLAGDGLTTEFTCTVRASLGVLDGDAQPPSAELISPANVQGAPLTPTIVLRFSELIDTTALQGSLGPATPIRIVVRSSLPTGECGEETGTTLGGVPQLSAELVNGRPVTVMQFIPQVSLGGSRCVTVYLTSQVRDLSGRSAVPAEFQFFTLASAPTPITLVETFGSATGQDPLASSGTWNAGARPSSLGGNGKHGSFSLSLLGPPNGNVYTWNTQSLTITGGTLTGLPETITDGRYFFTDFVVPANATIQFRGEVPARISVRGKAQVQGTLDVSGDSHAFDLITVVPTLLQPPIQVRGTRFKATGNAVNNIPPPGGSITQVVGQSGSQGYCGAGDGGLGGCEGNNLNTGLFNGIEWPDGQPGFPVTAPPGHVNGALAGPTRGLGSEQWPSNGLSPITLTPFIATLPTAREEFSRGGSGGGFLTAGGSPTVGTVTPPNPTAIQSNPPTAATVQPGFSPIPAGGAAFPLFPYPPASPPPGYQSIDHFLVGGSGGGGGGSHSFGILTNAAATDIWMAGHGGTGGGGALAIRAGGDVIVNGTLRSRGGDGVWINGDDRGTTPIDVAFGISSPGGGGSGGSFVVQSARTVTVGGTIDCSGGTGSQTGGIAPTPLPSQAANGILNIRAQGGNGSTGFYRLEGGVAVSVSSPTAHTPAFVNAAEPNLSNQGALTDRDDLTGDRSTWRGTGVILPPTWLYYELDVDTDGDGDVDIVFSDSGAPGTTPANDPAGIVLIRFQGAEMNGTVPIAESIRPWRSGIAGTGSLGTGLNGDNATGFRFDIVYNTLNNQVFVVKALRVFATS